MVGGWVTGQVALVPLAPDIFSGQLALGPFAVRFSGHLASISGHLAPISGQLAPISGQLAPTFYKCTKVSREYFLTASVDDPCLP
jgi:hypothetical protein